WASRSWASKRKRSSHIAQSPLNECRAPIRRSHMFKNRFAGRTAVITGGASGAGKAVAARLVAEGAQVALWDLNPVTLAQAQSEVGATSMRVVDVADPDAVQSASEASRAALSHIDLLVCSA